MNIQILIDNQNSWTVPLATKWSQLLSIDNMATTLTHDYKEVAKGVILCLLRRELELLDNTYGLCGY